MHGQRKECQKMTDVKIQSLATTQKRIDKKKGHGQNKIGQAIGLGETKDMAKTKHG